MIAGPPTPAPPSDNAFRQHWGLFVVLAAAAVIAAIRMRLVDLPLERDEGEYAYAGQLLLQGIPPYQLAYNMKFPGTYLAYAAIMALFGQTPIGIHLGVICVTTITAGMIYWFGRRFFDETTGAIAGSTSVIMSAAPMIFGLAGHATHFAAVFATAGLCLIWSRGPNPPTPRRVAVGGLMFGLGLLMKQHAALFCIWGFAMVVAQTVRQPRSVRVRLLGWLSGGVVLPFAATCLWLWRAGVFARFWFWTVSYARHYAVDTPLHNVWFAFQYGFLYGATARTAVFWLLGAVGLAVICFHPIWRPHRMPIVSFVVTSFLTTVPGLIFRQHYFLLVLPAVSVLVGCLISTACRWGVPRNAPVAARQWPLLAFALVAGWTFWGNRLPWFQLDPIQASHFIYLGNPFPEAAQIAGFVRENSPPESRLAVLGSEPEIYFLSRRHSATGYIYMYPLMELQPFAARMQSEMIREIEATRPETVVYVSVPYSWVIRPGSDRTILDWWLQSYHTNYTVIGGLPFGQSGRDGDLLVYQRK